jgi:putative transposase
LRNSSDSRYRRRNVGLQDALAPGALGGTYFVTASTYQRVHHFRGSERLRVLHNGLLAVAHDYGWQLEAWAVFSNHYHFVAHSPAQESTAQSLKPMLKTLHTRTAGWVKRSDRVPERQVWFNFRENNLTYLNSYFARLNYTHQNPVRHGLVHVANQFPWCSASWFERTASPAQIRTIYSFKTDRLQVPDEFDPATDWQTEK